MSDFITTRNALRDFITSKGKLKDLISLSGTSRSTVWRTFNEIESDDELVGQHITVWDTATKMVADIKKLVPRAKEVLSND